MFSTLVQLSKNPKERSHACPSNNKPTLLKLARLDGTTKSKDGTSFRQLESTIERPKLVTVTSWRMPNASQAHNVRKVGATIARRPNENIDNRIDRNTDNWSRRQDTTSHLLPIPMAEKRASCSSSFSKTHHVSRRITKPESEQEKKTIRPLSASRLSTETQIDHHRHQQCRPEDSNSQTKSVRFDSVHIREHSITVRDLDGHQGSITVTLDWPHTQSSRSIALDDYESIRERQGRSPRGRLRKLHPWQRKQLVRRVGSITEGDLQVMGNRPQ